MPLFQSGAANMQVDNDTLATLNDVSLSSLADGNVLAFDASASKWINSSQNITIPPDISTWIELNIQGSSVFSNNQGQITLKQNAGNDKFSYLLQPVPSGNWGLLAYLDIYISPNTGPSAGLMLYNASTQLGRALVLTGNSGICRSQIRNITATGATGTALVDTQTVTMPFYFHIQRGSTNVSYRLGNSHDFQLDLYDESLSASIAPTHIGICANSVVSGGGSVITLNSWEWE